MYRVCVVYMYVCNVCMTMYVKSNVYVCVYVCVCMYRVCMYVCVCMCVCMDVCDVCAAYVIGGGLIGDTHTQFISGTNGE